jgi:hypothetical protein
VNQLNNASPCPICGATNRVYQFEIQGSAAVSCEDCGLISLSVALSRNSASFSIPLDATKSKGGQPGGMTEFEASKKYLRMLAGLSTDIHDILLISEPENYFAAMAKEFGINVIRRVSAREMEEGIDIPLAVDAVVVIYQLEKCNAVDFILDRVYEVLKPGGVLFLVTLSLDSRPSRFFGQSWIGWRPENRYYFANINIQLLLWRFGFANVWLDKDLRIYTLAHIQERASGFPKTWLTRTIQTLSKILPSGLHNLNFRLPSSGMIVTARKVERNKTPVLSIVLPVYNEAATFPVLMEKLLNLELGNIRKEIIIVESNSQDGSRELVQNYRDRPGIKIIFQERPNGKGNAVREGLEHATGDVLIIQDADLEYDLNDYQALLEPVIGFKSPFVLGSRHGGSRKMRQFNDQQGVAELLNFGHVFFTTLLNILYHQNMKDPFTMYKVFRRDCLFGLKLECNRFDFDHELVIKLIRKGYPPKEIPVNYRSRSFKQGKKVRLFRDPLTWVWVDIKYRFAPIISNQKRK